MQARNFEKIGKSVTLGKDAMIASSHPLALTIGLEILNLGGNAVDAALAMNAVLCIAEPHMTGVGGDCFVMLSVDGSKNIKALNGSGKSIEKSESSKLRKRNISEISYNMPEAITIPGAVAGWCLLHKEHGYMPWKEILDPAIKIAHKGINVHERVAFDWKNNEEKLSMDHDTSNLFLKNGAAFEFMDNFKNDKQSI